MDDQQSRSDHNGTVIYSPLILGAQTDELVHIVGDPFTAAMRRLRGDGNYDYPATF